MSSQGQRFELTETTIPQITSIKMRYLSEILQMYNPSNFEADGLQHQVTLSAISIYKKRIIGLQLTWLYKNGL